MGMSNVGCNFGQGTLAVLLPFSTNMAGVPSLAFFVGAVVRLRAVTAQ